jgi:hypothetical protein
MRAPLKHILCDRQGRKDIRPTDIEYEMGDRLRGLRLCQAVIHRPIEMIGNLGDLTGSDERADRDQTAIAGSKVRPKPQVAEEYVGGVLDDARGYGVGEAAGS